jgi:hypothetical protein
MKRTVIITAMVVIMATLAPAYAQLPVAEQLTEMDKLRLEVINLKYRLADVGKDYAQCLADKGPLQDQANQQFLQVETQRVVEAINAAHPGFTFDPKKGTLLKKDTAQNVGDKK